MSTRNPLKRFVPTLSIPSPKRIGEYVLVAIVVAIFGFPIYWMFISGIKPIDQITSYPPSLIPTEITFDNFRRVLFETRFPRWMLNSLIVASGNVILSVTISIFAGYGLTRFDIPHKKKIAIAFIFTYMFPALMLAIPYYSMFEALGLLNSYTGLILAHSAVTVPFTVWLMWQFFQTVPLEWEESAWINGASRFRSMIEVALPGAIPGILASAIFAFAISWNDFTFALILIDEPSMTLLTVGVNVWLQGAQVYWDLVMTAATLLVVPPLILIFTLNKYILAGFSVGGFD